MAGECLLGLATARGGLRHLAHAARVLEHLDSAQAFQPAASRVESMLREVGCTMRADLVRASQDDGLDKLLAAALQRSAGSAPGSAPGRAPPPLHKPMATALKMLVLGLIRLFVRRCLAKAAAARGLIAPRRTF